MCSRFVHVSLDVIDTLYLYYRLCVCVCWRLLYLCGEHSAVLAFLPPRPRDFLSKVGKQLPLKNPATIFNASNSVAGLTGACPSSAHSSAQKRWLASGSALVSMMFYGRLWQVRCARIYIKHSLHTFAKERKTYSNDEEEGSQLRQNHFVDTPWY